MYKKKILHLLKSISGVILFVYRLMIGSPKNDKENYPRKCFWAQEKQTIIAKGIIDHLIIPLF